MGVFVVVTMAYNGGENNDNNNKSSCYSNTVAILLFNTCKCYINRAVLYKIKTSTSLQSMTLYMVNYNK